jgi:hypothetical protein
MQYLNPASTVNTINRPENAILLHGRDVIQFNFLSSYKTIIHNLAKFSSEPIKTLEILF